MTLWQLLVVVLVNSAVSDDRTNLIHDGQIDNDEEVPVIQINVEDDKEERVFTADELSQYDGSDETKPLYMAVKGTVFDVTEGKDFYGPGSEYHFMTGRDVSHGIAKWSFDPKHHHDNLDGLTKEELEELDKIYREVYLAKYPVVGITEKYAQLRRENMIHDEF
ncbi:neudesin-like [Corticium candelabrum]|uniref:neudesin-like n=1 Tax=Corticium candelabrum TaxID=121492 RepID=UPI002E25F841|nr:neudesin-like [Corticium candelabrum]